jgi:hypothetical protein
VRFPKPTREKLHEAGGRPVEIAWPKAAGEPRKGQTYTVQSSHQAGEFKILVLFTDETAKGWRVIARADNDTVHLLGKAGGYVTAAAGAMGTRKGIEPNPMGGPQFRSEVEPEAVSPEDELLFSRRAHELTQARIHEEINRVEGAIAALEDVPEFEHVKSDVRFLRSLIRKLEGRLLLHEVTT